MMELMLAIGVSLMKTEKSYNGRHHRDENYLDATAEENGPPKISMVGSIDKKLDGSAPNEIE